MKRNYQISSVLLFTVVLLVMGVLFGALWVHYIPIQEQQELSSYLKLFFAELPDLQHTPPLQEVLFEQLRYLFVLWVLGLSVLGFPFIWVMVFAKGMVLGFTVGFFVDQMSWRGLLMAAAAVLPQNLLLIPAILLAATSGILFSFSMLKTLFFRQEGMIRQEFYQYSLFMLAMGVVMSASALVETYASPAFLKWLMPLVSG